MKIGVSNAVMYPMQAENSLKYLIALGFDVFEFFYNCDEEISDSFIDEINAIKGNGEIISVHPYTAFAEAVMFFSGYRRRTDESIRKYAKSFRNARKLGAKYFTFHGDRAYGATPNTSHLLSEESRNVLLSLAKAADDEGIRLCLENVSWCKSADTNYLKAVYEEVDKIGFTLDLKQARRAGVEYGEYIRAMGDKLCNIHVSDYDKDRDCILPGEGIFDFKEFGKEIVRTGYKGDVLIEVYSQSIKNTEQLLSSKAFLNSVLL